MTRPLRALHLAKGRSSFFLAAAILAHSLAFAGGYAPAGTEDAGGISKSRYDGDDDRMSGNREVSICDSIHGFHHCHEAREKHHLRDNPHDADIYNKKQTTPTVADSGTQKGATTTAGGNASAGSGESRYGANVAQGNSQAFSEISGMERTWAEHMAGQLDYLQAQQQQARQSPAAQQRYNSTLARSVDAPQDLRPLYEESGIHTNRDLQRLGPGYLDNLAEATKKNEQLSNDWLKSARKALAAAGKLDAMSGTLAERGRQLSSLSGSKASPADSSQTSTKETGSAAASAGSKAKEASLSGITIGTPGDSSGKSASGAKEKADKEEKAATEQASLTDKDSASKDAQDEKSSKGGPKNSLRERLAELLKSKNGDAFAPRDLSPAKEGGGQGDTSLLGQVVDGALQSESGTSGSSRPPAFSMNSSETEAEIRALTKDLGESGRGLASANSFLGQEDMNLFQRVRLSLRRCQKDNCIRWR